MESHGVKSELRVGQNFFNKIQTLKNANIAEILNFGTDLNDRSLLDCYVWELRCHTDGEAIP